MKKVCSVCGDLVGPRNRSGMCTRCYDKAYRAENPNKVAAHQKAYYEANKTAISAQAKAYYEANTEKITAQQKAWREDNKEVIAARMKAWREDDPERGAARVKTWREANPDKTREYKHERRTYLSSYTDCTKLNKAFPGCDFHHLTTDTGVHVPASLHRSISHSLNHDRNMQEMNALAMDWLNGVRRESPQTTFEAFV